MQSIGVEDGRVAVRGSRDEVMAWADSRTRRIRITGGVVYPAFVESHGHLMSMGSQAEMLYVGSPPCRCVRDIVERVRARASQTPPGQWIVGVHYDDTLLAEMRPPTADELSEAAPHHPVYLSHMSGHAAVANWAAFALAGIHPESEHEGLVHDARHRLTGEMREAPAMGLVSKLLPEPSVEDRVRWLRIASEACLRVGVVSMSDSNFGGRDAALTGRMWQAYLDAERTGALGVRSQVFPALHARHHFPQTWQSPMLRLGPVKLFADGSIQAHTGALREPYHDHPDLRVAPFWTEDSLVATLRELRHEGRQVATHANGDAAIDLVLAAYRAVLGGSTDHRWRVEHAQTARRDQLATMRAIGVRPSFFIGHVEIMGDRHRDLFLGPERAMRISPLRWAKDLGLVFSLHSDAPVSTLKPLHAMATAVTRLTSSGAALGPNLRIDPHTALRAYTDWAAMLGFREVTVGSLHPGAWADFVVLSQDVEVLARGEEPEVLATFVGAEAKWLSGSAPIG